MEIIKEEDIKTEPASVELSGEDNADLFDPLERLQLDCIKIETSVESSTKVSENGAKKSDKRRIYSAIRNAFHKVLASMEMEEVGVIKITPKPPTLPPGSLPIKMFYKGTSEPKTQLQHACKLCHKSFGVHARLVTHECPHNAEPYARCKICNNKFLNLHRLDEHMKSHGKRTCDCERCGAIFANLCDLDNHTAKLHSKRSYECSRCFRKFYLASGLRAHNALTPRCSRKPFLKKKYACISCKKGYSRARPFDIHNKLHCQDPEELPYACGHCNAHFIYQKHLSTHERKCSEHFKVVVETEPPAPSDVENGHDDMKQECEEVVVEEDQDSRSWSNRILPIAASEDSYTIAFDSMEYVVQVESTEEAENDSNVEVSLGLVKRERTTSFESESFRVKAERLEEDVNVFHPDAVKTKTENLEENPTNDTLNPLIKDEKL